MSAPLPSPMLATACDDPPRGPEWAYEMKWDGYRAVVGVQGGQVRIVSRSGNDVSAKYPELAPLADAVPVDDVVLDGELVVLDDGGRPSFQAIQQHEAAATLMVFDVLRLDGRDLTSLPWSERRELLDRLGLAGGTWQTPSIVRGDADTALATATRLGLEGIVAKRVDAPYRPGKRTTAWQKVKLSKRQELVIGGWLPGERRLSGTVGSLLVGYHEVPGGAFRYAGRVGSGLDDKGRDALKEQLVPRATSPFAEVPPRLPDPRWVEPDVVVEVKFTEWTAEGALRQPVFLGIRTDKPPTDVVRE